MWDYQPTNHKLPKISPSSNEYGTTNQPITNFQKFLRLPINMGLPTNQSQTAKNFSVFQCIWEYLPTNHKLPKMSPSFNEYWTTNQPITNCQKKFRLPMNMGLPTNQSKTAKNLSVFQCILDYQPTNHNLPKISPNSNEYGTTNQPNTKWYYQPTLHKLQNFLR